MEEKVHTLVILVVVVFAFACCSAIYYERQIRLASLECIDDPNVQNRARIVPNYHHVNAHRDPLYEDSGRGKLSPFGEAFVNASRRGVENIWQHLCPQDTDGDHHTNGAELGDPCCKWEASEPHNPFEMQKAEWRRWQLSDPGLDSRKRFIDYWALFDKDGKLFVQSPSDCQEYNATEYDEMFVAFYYKKVRDQVVGFPAEAKHYISIVLTVATGLNLFFRKGLLADIMPCFFSKAPLNVFTSLSVNLIALVYVDLMSGIAHLVLDYMPPWIPYVGIVARGFQEHHTQPSLLARKPVWNQVNDLFMFLPVVLIFLNFANFSRVTRLFFVWFSCYSVLVLLVHPWAHMYPDMVPQPIRLLQQLGLLLNQEKHKQHHGDLESQFTILSGSGDLVIDHLSDIVPPYRYDIWCFIFTSLIFVPVFLDRSCNSMLRSLEKECSHQDELLPTVFAQNKVHAT